MKRLGHNRGGYRGERVAIGEVLRRVESAARKRGWTREFLEAGTDRSLVVLHRDGPRVDRNIYLSTGIHGDEPAGPTALLELLEADHWPESVRLYLCPCLNPTGCALHTRENREGVDLNRDYRDPVTAEVWAHVGWLSKLPRMDLTLCLHEDWEAEGFYLYELNPGGLPSLAEAIVRAVEPVCPIDLSEQIEGRPASGGIIRPTVDPAEHREWPEAFYLSQFKTPLSYTLETPSDFPLATRVRALVRGVGAALKGHSGRP